MKPSPSIRYLQHNEIDKNAWDACLDRNYPDLLYMRSSFLDEMVPGWQALVVGDEKQQFYDGIMALPARKKWGIPYLFQPYLTAQLGYVGNNNSSDELSRFIDRIPGRFRHIDICLNDRNPYLSNLRGMHHRINLVLTLEQSYDVLAGNFSDNTRRNIRQARENGLMIKREKKWRDAFEHYKAFAFDKPNRVEQEACARLLERYEQLGQLDCLYVFSKDEELVSTCIFLIQQKRLYYLFPANTAEARQSGSSFLLIDETIRSYAGSGMLLDFEGSDIESVARFYRGFGAVERNYPALRFNRFPF
ncbi:MAG: GNAT family N-acetyltransferase [Chitinophagaceae bacterium]